MRKWKPEKLPATVTIVEMTGAEPSYTTVNVANPTRYCTTDNVNSGGLTNPCSRPQANFNYSYWKHHCLNIQGSFTQVDNIRWYTDGACSWTYGANAASGIRVAQRSSGDQGCPTVNYTQATGTAGSTGNNFYDATNGHPYFKNSVGAPPAWAQNFTSTNPMTVDTGNYTAVGYSKSVVTQVWISSDATPGVQQVQPFAFMWDEI